MRIDILIWRLLLLQTIWKTFSRWCRNAWQTCFAYLKPSLANTRLSTLWTSWEQLVQSLPRSKVSKKGSALSQSTFKSIHSRRASQSLVWVLFLFSSHSTSVGVIVHRILWFSLIMSGFKGHKKKCFHFFFSIFLISPRNAISRRGILLSQGSVQTTVIFIPFFVCGCGRRVVDSLSVRRSACLHSGAACAFVWQLMWAPEDASSITYFLRMFSEDICESIGNQVNPLQCLHCEIDKRASVSQALLPLLKVKWQDRLQRSGTAQKQLALCKADSFRTDFFFLWRV